MLHALNREILSFNLWVFAVGINTAICFVFDFYQLFVSDNTFLSIVSLICLIVGFASCLKWATDGFTVYFLVYLVPSALILVTGIPGVERIGIDPGEFMLSAYAIAGSTLFPPLTAIITVPIATAVGGISKWAESYV